MAYLMLKNSVGSMVYGFAMNYLMKSLPITPRVSQSRHIIGIFAFRQTANETLSDIAPLGSYLLSGMLPITAESLQDTGFEQDQLVEVLQYSLWRLESIQQWQRETIFNELKSVADAMDIKMKPFLAPLFIAIAGSSSSISVMDSMALIGADMSRARLRYAIELLGGIGKKKLKKMEKAYQQLG